MEKIDKIIKPMFNGFRVKSIRLSPTDSKSFTFNVNDADVEFINPEDTTNYKTNTVSLAKGEVTNERESKFPHFNKIRLGHGLPADFGFTAISKVVNSAAAQIEAKGIAVDGVKCEVDLGFADLSDAVIKVTAQHQESSKANGRMVTVYYSEVHVKATLAGDIMSIDFSEFESGEK